MKIYEEFIKDNTTGSAIPHADKKLILNLGLSFSNIKKVAEFNQIVVSLFDKLTANLSQIRTLENLRDTLLPKLINGKVKSEMKIKANE